METTHIVRGWVDTATGKIRSYKLTDENGNVVNVPVVGIREVGQVDVTIEDGANLSEAIDFRRFALGLVHMPAAWTAAYIGFKVSPTEDGTYQPLYDDDGILVQIDNPAVDKSYLLPAKIAGVGWVKLWSQDGSGSNTNQDADRSLSLDLKA